MTRGTFDTAQNLSFSLRISSVNVTKSEVSCGFGPFTEKIPNGKLHFLCTENFNFFMMMMMMMIMMMIMMMMIMITNCFFDMFELQKREALF